MGEGKKKELVYPGTEAQRSKMGEPHLMMHKPNRNLVAKTLLNDLIACILCKHIASFSQFGIGYGIPSPKVAEYIRAIHKHNVEINKLRHFRPKSSRFKWLLQNFSGNWYNDASQDSIKWLHCLIKLIDAKRKVGNSAELSISNGCGFSTQEHRTPKGLSLKY
jgi:hypothetical protein